MSIWPSTKAKRVLAALLKIGWTLKRDSVGSHRVLTRDGWPDYVFAFHDTDEIGPRMMARIAKEDGTDSPPTCENCHKASQCFCIFSAVF